MGSVPTSLGEWIHSPWFDLGLVVWKGYRPRVRLVLAGGHASAWISPFWRGPAPEDDRPCFSFRGSQACQDAIAGRFPSNMGDIGRLYQLSEGIHVLQKRHNDLVHEANQAQYRVQQSWHTLSEAYAAFFNGEAIPQEAEEPSS